MRAVILALLCVLCACSSRPAPLFPDAGEVAYATVEEGYTDQSTRVVRQHLVIERALELVQHRQWHAASTTYPTGETSVAFQALDGRVLCMLWFGPGWVGAASSLDHSGPVLLDADKELRGELRRLFGLQPER